MAETVSEKIDVSQTERTGPARPRVESRSGKAKTCLYFLEYLLCRIVITLVNALPFKLVLRLANFFGRAILKANQRRVEIARFNLRMAFGDQRSDPEIDETIDQVHGRLFEIAVEFARIPKILKDPERWVPRVHPEYIWNALKEKKGVILLVSHYNNWEVLAIGGGFEGYPIHAVGKACPNPYWFRYVQRVRGKTGLKTIEKLGSLRDVSRLIKENQVVCLPMDQRVKGGEPVSFLGQTAHLSPLPVILALRYGTPVIPCFVYRVPGPRYLITATPPLKLVHGKDLKETLSLNTRAFAQRIEEEILKDPSNWVLWRHNIWKD